MASSSARHDDLTVRLSEISYGATGINLYRFSSVDGSALPDFEPGAHMDLQVCDEHRRQYSLLWPRDRSDSYSVAVQVAETGRGGSKTLHYGSRVGKTYCVSVPRNHFHLRSGGPRYALFAGGIGITPIVSMYRRLKREAADVTLYYWSADRDRTLFADELAQDGDVHLMHEVTAGIPPKRIAEVIRAWPMDTQLYCCGPEGMLNEFDAVCAERPEGNAHRERFSVGETLPADAFQVRLNRSNRVLTVTANESLLQVCLNAGVDVSYSCEEGVCGACEVKVLNGEIDHRDSVLSPQQRSANDRMMICCSRGKGSSLVLDI